MFRAMTCSKLSIGFSYFFRQLARDLTASKLFTIFFTVSDSSVVTWSKDGQVVSADSFKVIQDERLGKQIFSNLRTSLQTFAKFLTI
jgi:hypothetical protein